MCWDCVKFPRGQIWHFRKCQIWHFRWGQIWPTNKRLLLLRKD